MPHNHAEDENRKLNGPQKSQGSKKKATKKQDESITTTAEATTSTTTLDLTKAGSTPTGIIDILDDPDVAVWSKGIRNKTSAPVDKVLEPHHIKSITTTIEHGEGEEGKQSHLHQTVDPANKEEVAKAIDLGASLTDEATTSVSQRSKKAISSDEH
ncbi:MAG: hypothetical protein M3270_00055 [Thermoproteota archaeon]|nr:hypothetical protein [Thermoproteota archaeon]